MKFYVIAKFEDKGKANVAIQALKDLGHTFTADWTKFDSVGKAGAERIQYLQYAAAHDLQGVLLAEAVLLLHDDQLCNGLVEFGAALALRKLIVVVVPQRSSVARRQPLFYFSPDVHVFETVGSAVKFLHDSTKDKWE